MPIDPNLIREMSLKKDTTIIPNGDDCFKVLPIQPGEKLIDDQKEYGKSLREFTYQGDIKQIACPYWYRTDYGMVQCRFLKIEGMLEDEEGARDKAIQHFGSEEAFENANIGVMLYDEIKCCGINVTG